MSTRNPKTVKWSLKAKARWQQGQSQRFAGPDSCQAQHELEITRLRDLVEYHGIDADRKTESPHRIPRGLSLESDAYPNQNGPRNLGNLLLEQYELGLTNDHEAPHLTVLAARVDAALAKLGTNDPRIAAEVRWRHFRGDRLRACLNEATDEMGTTTAAAIEGLARHSYELCESAFDS